MRKIIIVVLLFLLSVAVDLRHIYWDTTFSLKLNNRKQLDDRRKNQHQQGQHISQIDEFQTDYGKHNVFLQLNQKYVLTPALLFDSESSFKVEYKLQISNQSNNNHVENPSQIYSNIKQLENNQQLDYSQTESINRKQPTKDLYEIHPALQKISSYDLTIVDGINVTDCIIVDIFFQSDEVPFLICLRKSKILQVFKIEETQIRFQFSFNVSYSWNQMSIVSETEFVFYNNSNIHFYSYNRQNNTASISQLNVQPNLSIQKCKPYIENTSSQKMKLNQSKNKQTIDFQKLLLICYTNNNEISRSTNGIEIPSILTEIKKDYIVVLDLGKIQIQQINHFQLSQKISSLNHIVGFDVIDSLENVIMLCYNLYKIGEEQNKEDDKENNKGNVFDTIFASSYCSIFKIYIDESQMVLINRMLLQPSPYPLLETSLQINVMLAVATQNSITFYHLDVLKEMFQFIQKILVPQNESFNCYEFSKLKNSFDSLSLSCAKDGQDSKSVSFVMIYDEDLQKYIAVGNVIVGKRFFHSSKVIFELDEYELILRHATQQYVVFNYVPVTTYVRIYEVLLSKPQQKENFTTITIIPAQYGQVYVNKPLPFIIETNYDIETYLDLKDAFEGSNISFVKVEVLDEKGHFVQNHNYLSQDRIYSYDYSLLLSVYIRQECIRVIKIDDSSFYRILRIEKSRVDEAQKNNVWEKRENNDNDQNNEEENNKNGQNEDDIEYYYYTETCSKMQGAYVCQLTQVHSISSGVESRKGINQQLNTLKIESTRYSKVIDIQFLTYSNMFVYLFQWRNINTQQQDTFKTMSPSHFGLMFVNMIENDDEATLHCYELKLLIQQIYQKVLTSEEVQQQKLNVTKVQLSKDWLFFEINLAVKFVKVYCLINNVKTYFFSSQQKNKTLQIQNSCIILHQNGQQLSQSREFIQDSRLMVSQIVTSPKTGKKSRKFTVFKVINSDQIVKQGTYIFQNTKNSLIQPKREGEFIGFYKQYMIMVNETTISKYHMGIKPELVYEFVYNPDFGKLDRVLQGDEKEEENVLQVKYVLFLERYLIVQFESFYQLYDIGGQLISIQIAANNFIAYQQTLPDEQRIYLNRLKSPSNSRISNVIINDAFLIEGDNIIIYEKDHLVVAKYITNPRLTLGSFEKSHLAVQKDLQLKLTPVLDYFIESNQVFQDVMLKIIYSQYVVQKIAKKIKTLTVPSQTQNYELEIWTNVFRGPVLQYYLSDTFDSQIVLKQHIQQVEGLGQKNEPNQNQSDDFLIVEYHLPFETKYIIKRNSSHLLIEEKSNDDEQGLQTHNSNTNQKYFIPSTKQLSIEVFLKFAQFNSTMETNSQIICILTDKSVVFVKTACQNNSSTKKFVLLGSVNHNVTMEIAGNKFVTSVEMEVLSDKTKDQKKEQGEQTFIFALLGSQQSKQNNQSLNKSKQFIKPSSIQLLQISLQMNSSSQKSINVTKTQQLIIEEEIFHIRARTGINKEPQLVVLTYLQSLRFYKISGDKDQSLLELRQSVNLKDIIPPEYWLDNQEKYVKFQIFDQSSNYLNSQKQNSTDNLTLLLFSQTDKAFHVEFEVYKSVSNEDKYNFELKNIYAGYPNFKFLSLVQIGLKKSEEKRKDEKHKNDQFTHKSQSFGDSSIFDSQKQEKSKSKDTPKWYIYFIVLNEYTATSQVYLTYYSFNYNFTTTNKEVGYFKCGEKISLEEDDDDDDDDDENQNGIERRERLVEKDEKGGQSSIKDNKQMYQIIEPANRHKIFQTVYHNIQDNNNKKIHYLFSFYQNDLILVQIVNFTTASPNSSIPQLYNNQSLILIQQTTLQVNTSIYMILNYQKPPIVSYVLLNARNFNVRAGIYTKFIFLEDSEKWTVFFIVFPIVLLLFVGCGFLLKKHQPKNLLINDKSEKLSIQEIIYSSSSSSRSIKTKQQRLICIDSSDEESSNYRSSLQADEEKNLSPTRMGYIPPDSFRINKGSSVNDSPLKSYPSEYSEDIDESDIECTPTIKLITGQGSEHFDNDHEEDKEILSYLISKKGSFASNNSSFAK